MPQTYEDIHSPQYHKSLSDFAAYANIPVQYITESASGKVPPSVAQWLVNYPKETSIIVNLADKPWDENEVAFAMAGMLTRNLILAKVLSMSQFYDAIDLRKVSEPTCLILPGFQGKSKVDIPDWKLAVIMEALKERVMLGKRTVLMIRNKATLGTVFGTALLEVLQTKFEMVNA